MHSPTRSKLGFLKKWAVGLKYCNGSLSFMERKKIIKLSADIAMASTRNGKTNWSQNIISKAFKQDENKNLVMKILGDNGEYFKRVAKLKCNYNKIVRSKKILRISCNVGRKRKHEISARHFSASSIAKTMVKRRTEMLKKIVPGGDSIVDELRLLEETLDYILSLQAQVDVMRGVVDYMTKISS